MERVKEEQDVAKVRSCATLNTFYQETQQEIGHLEQQVILKDGLINELKAKLARYERTCLTEGEERLTFGPSRSIVDSMCKEILKLKQKLKDSETEATLKVETGNREIHGLQQKLSEKEQELENVLRRPEHVKDQEIQHLRSVLAERDRAQATRAVMCNSLAEEAEQLRVQLGATVRVCQDLLGRLENEKNRVISPEHKAQGSEMIESSEAARLNAKVQEENQQLKKRVAYVESLNSRWQKYDLSREEYVRELCQKLKESNGLAGSGSPLAPAGAASGSTALFQQEISRLNKLLEEKMLECERLGRERDDSARRDHERIQMLEQQVLAYIEDFKSERADRERAQGKILDLQEEVRRLQLQIHAQNSRESQPTRRLHISLKKPARKQTEPAEPLLRNSPPESSTKRTARQLPTQGTNDLLCPLCLTTYDDKNTDEFINHCEECARL